MDFDELFESCSEAFRLEALPVYDVEEEAEAIEQFRATGTVPSGLNADWLEMVASAVGRGATVRRLRLVGAPPTDYERFELEAYKLNCGVGEDIRLALRDGRDSIPEDFWMFEMGGFGVMGAMVYDQDGAFVRMDIHKASKEEVDKAMRWRKVFDDEARPVLLR